MGFYLSDSHSDFLTAIKTKQERAEYIKKCSQEKVKLISSAVFTSESDFSIEDIKDFNDEIKDLSNKYQINLLLSIEDLGFIKNDNDLIELIKLKPFCTTLTWNEENQFGGGANSEKGLTSYGKEVVALLEKNNVLIDTAHLSKKAFYDFIEITKFPIYNSHSNIGSILLHQRNLTDFQIQQIVESKGYLGLTIYEKFISDNKISSANLAKQFDYLINRFGFDNFGFGTDLYGINSEFLPIDIKTYSDLNKVAICLPKYNKEVIAKIMYKNFLNFVYIMQD